MKRGAKMKEIASMIDHTLLKPEATYQQIIKLCEEANQYSFASVCVNPYWVKVATQQLKGSKVKICTVIGFPLGATTTEGKVFETCQAIEDGATEVDMVINIGAFKSGDMEVILYDMQQVVKAANGYTVKVIIEIGAFTDNEIQQASKLVQQAGAHFVKTSTGFGYGGATIEAIQLIRAAVGPHMGIKASGGIRDLKTAKQMIAVGANRLGTSSGVSIVGG
jgi:deoxyribose-phosphate aldolase